MKPPMIKRLFQLTAFPAIALTVLAAGCDRGGGPPAPERLSPANSTPTTAPADLKQQNVSIDNFSFSPATLTVSAGTTVAWVNHDDVPHTVTANDKAFGSKAMDTDERYLHEFTAPGVYPYFCAVHPHMTGQIIVK